jgi:hypothetical protein
VRKVSRKGAAVYIARAQPAIRRMLLICGQCRHELERSADAHAQAPLSRPVSDEFTNAHREAPRRGSFGQPPRVAVALQFTHDLIATEPVNMKRLDAHFRGFTVSCRSAARLRPHALQSSRRGGPHISGRCDFSGNGTTSAHNECWRARHDSNV